MLRKTLGYGAGLIALYIVVANASLSGGLITAGAKGGSDVIKSLQGRG